MLSVFGLFHIEAFLCCFAGLVLGELLKQCWELRFARMIVMHVTLEPTESCSVKVSALA